MDTLLDTSNFDCLPGRAGGPPLVARTRRCSGDVSTVSHSVDLNRRGHAPLHGAWIVTLLFIVLAYDVILAKVMLRYEMNDFGKFYHSALYFLQGRDLYAASPATLIPVSNAEWRQFTNMNPPHFHLVVLPSLSGGPGSPWLAG